MATPEKGNRQYEDPGLISVAEAEAAIVRNDPAELYLVPISVSLYAEDFEWAQGVCLRLADHPHGNVRGNALLGFGHLARRFRRLDRIRIEPLIRKGLQDTDDFVRGQADAAADDIAHFLAGNPGP